MSINEEKELENARIGYQVAVDLWTFQSNLNWGRFNAMLTANSIITAVIGIVLFSQTPFTFLKIVLPIIGLFFCLFWFLLMVRGRDYHKYWISQACEIEEKYLDSAVNIVSGMASKNEKRRKIRFSKFSKSKLGSSQDVAIYGVIIAFTFVYIATLIQMVL